MREKIVIGVVLIPSKDLLNYAVSLNKKAKSEGKFTKKLGFKYYVPHITLGFCLVYKDDVKRILKKIERISEKTKSINVVAQKVVASKTRPLEKSLIEIKKTKELVLLHKKIAKELLKYRTKDVKEKHFYEGEKTGISDNAIEWVENLLIKKSFKKYYPHITLRCQKTELKGMPHKSISSFIAVYHMSDGCTCKKLIKKYKLKK